MAAPLSAAPESVSLGFPGNCGSAWPRDGVRAPLVDVERAQRRKSVGALGETLNPNTLDVVSETPTQPIDGDAAPDDTQVEAEGAPAAAAVTVDQGVAPTGLRSTRNPSNVNPTEEQLSFAIDEGYHLQSEAETLRAMLNTVRFTLVRRLGAGGMGVVYETYDQQRGELVALKTMRKVDPGALVRFKQEFRSLSDITHPNLANLYELFAIEDRWFFTMELVDGCNFISYVKGTPEEAAARWNAEPTMIARPARSATESSPAARMPNFHFDEKRLREALVQLALGVSALHAAGKLHRDIKPPNVLVTLEGRVVLLDFGLAADLESVGADQQVVGTVGHMSPEQAAGESVSTASDWYSVGVMLFEAMTGQLPFAGEAEDVLAAKQTLAPLTRYRGGWAAARPGTAVRRPSGPGCFEAARRGAT